VRKKFQLYGGFNRKAGPTHLAQGEVKVQWQGAGLRTVSADEGVTVDGLNPLTLRVQLKNSGGRTLRSTIEKFIGKKGQP
jgi:hypothetical protein